MDRQFFFSTTETRSHQESRNLVQKIGSIFQNRRWDETSLDEMEESLIAADVGVNAVEKLMETLRRQSPDGKRGRRQEMSARLQGRPGGDASGLETSAQARSRFRCDPGSFFFSASTASAKQPRSASSPPSTVAPARRSCSSPATPFAPPRSSNSISGASALASMSSSIAQAQTRPPWFSTACKPPKAAA